jgi:hypothetical protein
MGSVSPVCFRAIPLAAVAVAALCVLQALTMWGSARFLRAQEPVRIWTRLSSRQSADEQANSIPGARPIRRLS